jgi:hypothetical protein
MPGSLRIGSIAGIEIRIHDSIWFGLIGWFLLNGAQTANSQMALETMLKGVTVSQVMNANPTTVPSGSALLSLLAGGGLFRRGGQLTSRGRSAYALSKAQTDCEDFCDALPPFCDLAVRPTCYASKWTVEEDRSSDPGGDHRRNTGYPGTPMQRLNVSAKKEGKNVDDLARPL